MSAQAAKLMGNSFYGRMIEDLDRLPTNAQEWIKGMQEMFNKAVCNNPWALRHVPEIFRTQKMCNKALARNPYMLKFIPDRLKTEEMCKEAVRREPYVPDYS